MVVPVLACGAPACTAEPPARAVRSLAYLVGYVLGLLLPTLFLRHYVLYLCAFLQLLFRNERPRIDRAADTITLR